MLLQLVKKDFLIVKKYVFFMMLLAVAVPLFVAWQLPEITGVISFIYTVVFTELIICQAVSAEESKYPKATALLCSVPYTRSTIVKAKYVFFLLLFAYCWIVYTLMAVFVPGVGAIDLTVVLSVLLAGMIVYGIYLPLYFKYGAEKTRFFFMICIFIMAFGMPVIYNYLAGLQIDFSVLASIPVPIVNLIMAVLFAVALGVSVAASIRIYSKKEL